MCEINSSWVAVKELKSSYRRKEPLSFAIYIYVNTHIKVTEFQFLNSNQAKGPCAQELGTWDCGAVIVARGEELLL